ncbi:MAG TPA: hypothetical protein PKD48_04325 [Sphingopyxis sp.]|nr:hypothetical protein [Sphingopyxis sp.]HMQ18095.1 hypothetical protein [Sphingopyxis sp.]
MAPGPLPSRRHSATVAAPLDRAWASPALRAAYYAVAREALGHHWKSPEWAVFASVLSQIEQADYDLARVASTEASR